jgi:hypothetical protein
MEDTMSTIRKIRLLLPFILLTGLFTACSNSFPSAQTTATPPPTGTRTSTSQPLPSQLVGTYISTITQQDIAATHNSRIAYEVQPGGWNLVFRSDGYYVVQTNYHPYGMSYVGEGTYTIKGHQMILKDGNCWEYFGDAGRFGTFTWSLQGNRLVFTALQDTCASRQMVFTVHPWVRQAA